MIKFKHTTRKFESLEKDSLNDFVELARKELKKQRLRKLSDFGVEDNDENGITIELPVVRRIELPIYDVFTLNGLFEIVEDGTQIASDMDIDEAVSEFVSAIEYQIDLNS